MLSFVPPSCSNSLVEPREAFFDAHEERLGYRFPPIFRKAFLARRVVTARLRLWLPDGWLNPLFLMPDEWVRVEDADAYNVPDAARGVVIASDANQTVFLAAGAEPGVLEEELWFWPTLAGVPYRLADDLDRLFDRKAHAVDAWKKLEREGTAFLRAAAKRGRAPN